jgi:hypothetical protein
MATFCIWVCQTCFEVSCLEDGKGGWVSKGRVVKHHIPLLYHLDGCTSVGAELVVQVTTATCSINPTSKPNSAILDKSAANSAKYLVLSFVAEHTRDSSHGSQPHSWEQLNYCYQVLTYDKKIERDNSTTILSDNTWPGAVIRAYSSFHNAKCS